MTEEQSLLRDIESIHEQVRKFVESQQPCKVIRIAGSSTSNYMPPMGERVTAEAEMLMVDVTQSFHVEAVEVKHYPGTRMAFRVDVVSDVALEHCLFVMSGQRLG